MTNLDVITDAGVQHDESGVGHCWRTVDADTVPSSIAEEITCWIIEERPEPGTSMTASNGMHYRLPPE